MSLAVLLEPAGLVSPAVRAAKIVELRLAATWSPAFRATRFVDDAVLLDEPEDEEGNVGVDVGESQNPLSSQ
jgi:hypothetical protein